MHKPARKQGRYLQVACFTVSRRSIKRLSVEIKMRFERKQWRTTQLERIALAYARGLVQLVNNARNDSDDETVVVLESGDGKRNYQIDPLLHNRRL